MEGAASNVEEVAFSRSGSRQEPRTNPIPPRGGSRLSAQPFLGTFRTTIAKRSHKLYPAHSSLDTLPWHVSKLQRMFHTSRLTPLQSSESRLYTFSDETKQKLRKFRLGTSRAKDPQAIICMLA